MIEALEVRLSDADRDRLGRLVRETWVRAAVGYNGGDSRRHLPWDELTEEEKEVGRQIGERLYLLGAAEALAG